MSRYYSIAGSISADRTIIYDDHEAKSLNTGELVKQLNALERDNAELRFEQEILQKKFIDADECAFEREEIILKKGRDNENLKTKLNELQVTLKVIHDFHGRELEEFIQDKVSKLLQEGT